MIEIERTVLLESLGDSPPEFCSEFQTPSPRPRFFCMVGALSKERRIFGHATSAPLFTLIALRVRRVWGDFVEQIDQPPRGCWSLGRGTENYFTGGNLPAVEDHIGIVVWTQR